MIVTLDVASPQTCLGSPRLRGRADLPRLAAHRGAAYSHALDRPCPDVGANTGQYAKALLASGYQGLVTSLEPNPRAAKELRATAAGRPAWTVHEVALTSSEGRMTLHVTDDSQSTSLLVPTADYAFMQKNHEVEVDTQTLDAFGPFASPADAKGLLLKMDVQGFEGDVLRGAARTLESCSVVECELSTVELYAGQALMEEVIAQLRRAGLFPVALVRGFTDPTSHNVIQYDGIFARSGSTRG
ncbi:MAG: FkbM family methyltransferase [Actinomycetales bacterium]|uniref:FkbM family methyltransferase n=1 Tax=Candidatus Phosphoribacter hodrii TaxID=2953743 RepID=A0A935M4R9_9MICO|nr:FkbM family methyltransferase [Candidatus Phosphoribacter hodrii]